jgi:excisionase family DNA binding protein
MNEQQQPEIERLLAAPEDAGRVALADIPGLLARLASAQLQLAGLQAALLARLLTSPGGRAGAGDRLLDMEAVAKVLDVPVPYARDMGRRHELPIVKVGRHAKVRESSLYAWLKQREELGGAPTRVYHPRPKRTVGASARVVPLHQPEADR